CFFQAEDGIRDWSVTGVQTCALPISAEPVEAVQAFDADDRRHVGLNAEVEVVAIAEAIPNVGIWRREAAADREVDRFLRGCQRRSEERRVGKEWRSRRAA